MSESNPTAEQAITLEVIVRNQGTGLSDTTTLRYYRSADSTVTPEDEEVGSVLVPGLNASANSTQSIITDAPSTPGTYYYGACVDPVLGESNSANNCSNAVAIDVLPLPSDLSAGMPTASEINPIAGQTFALETIVRNQGAGASSPTTLRYYRSTDSTVTYDDTEVGVDHVVALETAGISVESILTQAPSEPGMYYYGVCADAVSRESDTTNNCSEAVAVTVSKFDINNLPWVADGITATEQQAMIDIRFLARIDPLMSQRVAGSLWLSDEFSEGDLQAIADLLAFARSRPQVAALLTTIPDQTGELMLDAVFSLQQINHSGGGARLDQVLSQPWFQDGLTQEEAALIVTLESTAETEEVYQDLVANGHVISESISLPLAGEVDLFAVSRSEAWLEGALERMREAAETMEDFLASPWPKLDTIMLLEFDSDLGEPSVAGINYDSHVMVKNTSKNLTYHELAHYYFDMGPFWLSEGWADFLMLHTLRLTEPEELSIDAGYFEDQHWITEDCASNGWDNVQGWIETGTGPGTSYCPYLLGRQFLAGVYRGLGYEVISSAMRELYERARKTGRSATEGTIYQAFLDNTPPSQQDEFRDLYHCLHGGPIPGYTPASKAALAPENREALVTLYNATNGPGWTNSENWLSDAPLDQWYGVNTDCDGSITVLDLRGNELKGTIPAELGNLSSLRFLNLNDNQLTGEIPRELGRLLFMHRLRLGVNQLTGDIPVELSNLTNLRALDLGGNQLTGGIPAEMGKLSNLRGLVLNSNPLGGNIPTELGNLSNLVELWIGYNQLTGEIPKELGNLSNLIELRLDGNQLTGGIPAELGNLSYLAGLSLWYNQLTGEIPAELGNLSNLQVLGLGFNQLTGEIPAELGNLSNLWDLGLSGNQLSGCVPQGLAAVENSDLDSLSLEICPGP